MTRREQTEPVEKESAFEEILSQIQRRRKQAGFVALGLSLVAHILVAWYFPYLPLKFTTHAVVRERTRQIILNEVTPLPTLVERAVEKPVKPLVRTDLPAEAARDTERVDKSIIEPRLPPGTLGLEGVKSPDRKPGQTIAQPSWQPRQEILMINKMLVGESLPRLPRRMIPVVPRVPNAADLVYQADRTAAVKSAAAVGNMPGNLDFSQLDLSKAPTGEGGGGGLAYILAGTIEPADAVNRITVDGNEGKRKRLEKYLTVEARKYVSRDEPYGYCVINVRRIGSEVLPILPKDILLVQDCSASITEQRLHFCRTGWSNALACINPGDRFNIVGFSDRVERCFPDWTAPDPAALGKAQEFIDGMKSHGDTDVYGSLRALLEEKRVTGRPLVALMISDGLPTVGETDSSSIIEEFSRNNKGALSIFTMGTIGQANVYLLDMVSYRNRGDSFVVTSGRWDIPAAVEGRMRGISRPVLTDVGVVFAAANNCEALPSLPSNLYLDRSLVLFCRYPKNLDQMVFQITGRAGDAECDMVFNLDLGKTPEWNEDIRTRWAWQKIYSLMGEYTRTRNAEFLQQRNTIAEQYNLKIPYSKIPAQ